MWKITKNWLCSKSYWKKTLLDFERENVYNIREEIIELKEENDGKK